MWRICTPSAGSTSAIAINPLPAGSARIRSNGGLLLRHRRKHAIRVVWCGPLGSSPAASALRLTISATMAPVSPDGAVAVHLEEDGPGGDAGRLGQFWTVSTGRRRDQDAGRGKPAGIAPPPHAYDHP
jgi:hypothetical protein